MSTTVLVTSFPPFPTFVLNLPCDTILADVPSHLPVNFPKFNERKFLLSTHAGLFPALDTPLRDLLSSNVSTELSKEKHDLVSLRITPRMCGGKGGFGSQLRAAGGRMSSQKTSNNDSCRDLNGRRLSTLKEAKALAAYLEGEPERKKAQAEAQKAKLEALEKKLGINPGEASSTKPEDISTGAKRRFDDTEYIEQSKELVDNVKSAVTAGLLKKRKKAKPAASEASKTPGETASVEKVAKSTVATPVAAVAATAVGA